MMITSSEITIEWDQIKNENPLYIYAIILHEFSHALGLGDVYYENNGKIYNYIDMTTFMNTEIGPLNPELYPNDYSILQALYSDEYKNHENYEDAVRVVNKKIEKYTKAFYAKYASYLKENVKATDLLSKMNVMDEIEWKGQFENSQIKYNLKLLDKDTCELTISNNEGNVIEKCNGDILFVDGMLFARNLVVKNANNYGKKYEENKGIKLTLSIYINSLSQLVVTDGLFNIIPIKFIMPSQYQNNSK